jgi:hypothetical protein
MVQIMKFTEKYDKMPAGLISGFVLPLITGLVIFLFSAHGRTLSQYLERIVDANIMTHAITLCVFPNVAIFLLFNRYDMLKAARGVLAMTIVWAISVFIIKFI